MSEEITNEITEEQLQNLALLERVNSHSLLVLLGTAITEQRHNMIKAQGDGQLKNNKFNEGYMTALNDIKVSIEYLIKENIKYVNEATRVSSSDEGSENTSTGSEQGSGHTGSEDNSERTASIGDSESTGTGGTSEE